MLIRFPNFVQHGNVQHQAGDVLEMPDELAQAHIDAGNAVQLEADEVATMPRHVTPDAVFMFSGRQAKKKKGKR